MTEETHELAKSMDDCSIKERSIGEHIGRVKLVALSLLVVTSIVCEPFAISAPLRKSVVAQSSNCLGTQIR